MFDKSLDNIFCWLFSLRNKSLKLVLGIDLSLSLLLLFIFCFVFFLLNMERVYNMYLVTSNFGGKKKILCKHVRRFVDHV